MFGAKELKEMQGTVGKLATLLERQDTRLTSLESPESTGSTSESSADGVVLSQENYAILEQFKDHGIGLCGSDACGHCAAGRQKLFAGFYEQFDKAARWGSVIPAHQELGQAMRKWIDAGRPEVEVDDDGPDETPVPAGFIRVTP